MVLYIFPLLLIRLKAFQFQSYEHSLYILFLLTKKNMSNLQRHETSRKIEKLDPSSSMVHTPTSPS